MTDLPEFLLARIAEDETVAEEAAREGYEHWRQGEEGENPRAVFYDGLNGRVVQGDVSTWPAEAAHIARWDPVRVLAECEAKRRLIRDLHGLTGYTHMLELLALPLADHPGWREDWRP